MGFRWKYAVLVYIHVAMCFDSLVSIIIWYIRGEWWIYLRVRILGTKDVLDVKLWVIHIEEGNQREKKGGEKKVDSQFLMFKLYKSYC